MLFRAGHGHLLHTLGLAAASLGLLLVGCAGPQREDKSPQDNREAAVAPADQPAPAVDRPDSKDRPALSKRNTPPPARQTGDDAQTARPTPRDELDEGRVVGTTPSGATITRVGPEEEPAYPSEEDLERRREEASDMIYALIRVRMEEAIIKRVALLEGGSASSDLEVRRLESVIMNARQYLEEDGEIVVAVVPPIVQTLGPGSNKTP